MKDLIFTYFVVLVLTFVFLFFGGAVLLENFWVSVAVFSLLLTIIICAFLRLSDKIDRLEKRIEYLEAQKKDA